MFLFGGFNVGKEVFNILAVIAVSWSFILYSKILRLIVFGNWVKERVVLILYLVSDGLMIVKLFDF